MTPTNPNIVQHAKHMKPNGVTSEGANMPITATPTFKPFIT